MKYSVIYISIVLVSAIQPVAAKGKNDAYIETASQFQKWCKHLSYRHFRLKKQKPYNWSASTFREFNDYQTMGSWKVNNDERQVFCHIRVGKKAKYTILEIDK